MSATVKMTARLSAVLALVGVSMMMVAGPAGAQTPAPAEAVSYINPDTGAASANPDVDPNSGCGDEAGESPDKDDTQTVITDPMTDNVHTDACIFDDTRARIDVQAAFEVSGVGSISGCPDPDGMDEAGMEADDKSATLSEGDTRCVLSGYEDANDEYHVRTVSDTPGTQTITFCSDPEGNGCDDAEFSSITTVNWVADDGGQVPAGGVDTGLAPLDGPADTTGSTIVTIGLFTLGLILSGAAIFSWTAARRARA